MKDNTITTDNPHAYEHLIEDYYQSYCILKKEKPEIPDLFFTKLFLFRKSR